MKVTYVVDTYKDMEFADEIEYSASFDNYDEAVEYFRKEVGEANKQRYVSLSMEEEIDCSHTETTVIGDNWEGNEYSNFLNDVDKMYDFLELSEDEFLESYSYLRKFEYQNTLKKFEEDKVGVLVNLIKKSIEMQDNNIWNVTSEEFSGRVYLYAVKNLKSEEYDRYIAEVSELYPEE